MSNQNLWWQRGVIYQIYPRSFQDSNGDGLGDLAGIVERLDYLNDGTPHSLGVDALWLSPIYPSPMADFGYDVADYTDIDPVFGDLAAFDQLLAAVHKRDMRLILDFVPNHSSSEHPWFKESRSSRDNPRRDWYIWADPKPDGSPPNNWLSVFGGAAWEWDEATGQYYLHSFLKEQPDLNWRNPQVRAAMLDVLRFWLDRGVDGFRIDVVARMIKDDQLRDNPPNPRPPKRRRLGPHDSQLPIYTHNRPEIHEIIREFRRVLDSYDERFSVGEVSLFWLSELMKYYGENLDGLHFPFNFTLMRLPWQAELFRRRVDLYEAALPPGAWPNYVLGNHDEHRLASRFGVAQARVAAMLLLTLRGTPTLYYGDELGMTDVEIPPAKEQDPFGIRVPGLGLGRDPERTPMQWDAGPNAGFSERAPWLPVAPDYQTVNVEAQQADPTSLLNLYKRLIWRRKASPALIEGRYRPLDGVPGSCFVYLREHESQRMLIALNFSAEEQDFSLAEAGQRGRLGLSTHLDREGAVDLAAFHLRAHEGCLVDLT